MHEACPKVTCMRNMQVMRSAGPGVCTAAGRRSGGSGSSADDGDGPSLADYLEFGAQQDAHADGPHRSYGTAHGGGAIYGPRFMVADCTGTVCRWCTFTERSSAVQGGCWERSPMMWSGDCRRLVSWQRRTSGRSSTCRGEKCACALAPCSVTLCRPVTVASEWQHGSEHVSRPAPLHGCRSTPAPALCHHPLLPRVWAPAVPSV